MRASTMNDGNCIEARGLRVRFGRDRVLEDLDLEVREGSVTALCGSNGAGKSTLLRVLVGALVPDGGSATVLGLDPSRQGAQVRGLVGYVPDRIEVPRRMRGGEWLSFVARFYPTWCADEQRRLSEVLGLDDSAQIGNLSKGNRAKLALVAALAHRPRLALLDEPFSGLDIAARDAIAAAVIGHLRDEGRTVLLVSHSIADVERLADRVAVLEHGRIVREGDLERVARARDGGVDLESTLRALAGAGGVR
jgi:ABC-2 type transport system ATP-binding protein